MKRWRLSNEVVDKYFTNTVSRVGGITIRDIQNDLEARHKQAFDPLGLDISMEPGPAWVSTSSAAASWPKIICTTR